MIKKTPLSKLDSINQKIKINPLIKLSVKKISMPDHKVSLMFQLFNNKTIII